jgi:2-polyprenyl-6-methoxyphenol hydroxylase-like FAD-dependent oxidoreductase
VGVAVDGSPWMTLSADVLVGADGIHSGVRALVFGPEEEYLRPLGMRAAAFIVTDPLLNARFRNRFVLTDSIDRTVGLYGLRTDEVAAFMVYRRPQARQGTSDPGVCGSRCARVRRTRPRGRPAAGPVPRASVRRRRRTDHDAGLAQGTYRSPGGRLRRRVAPGRSRRLARHRRCRATGGHPGIRGVT